MTADLTTATDLDLLSRAVELSRHCPPSDSAFSVGAVLTAADGRVLATGYSREGGDDRVHAEEAALAKLPADALVGGTVYSSLEPCSTRASRPTTCTELILASGAARVVFAWREPAVIVDGRGAEELASAGLTVVEVPELADAVREINAHVLRSGD
jgi:pyrimidine deaminase RibD-like protein